jgi:hypothetical protein
MQEKIISLIRDNPKAFKDFSANSTDDGKIAEAEKALGLKFNDQYIWFLKNGISENYLFESPETCVKKTLKGREAGLPLHFLAIKNDAEFEDYCLDCIDTETGKIVNYFFGDDGIETSEKFPDFYSFYADYLEGWID